MKIFSNKIFFKIYTLALFSLVAYFGYGLLNAWMNSLSVTSMNVAFGIIVLLVSLPLGLAGAMANDSGKGGFGTTLSQLLLLSVPLVYLIGLVSSIAVLYSETFDGQQEIAFWLASMSGFHLLIIIVFLIVFFGWTALAEKFRSDKYR